MRFFNRHRNAASTVELGTNREQFPIAKPGELRKRLDGIETTLQRLWRDIDFIRNRMSSYVGDGIALTYLVDDTPMFVNSNDRGTIKFIDGGRYEEDNLEVLLSFVTPDTVFIDIGANVGFFTLQIARRLTGDGKVYAFEPHPEVAELLQRNVFANGLSRVVSCFSFALSDQNAAANLQYPIGHLGGGHVADSDEFFAHTLVKSESKRLDDVLGSAFSADLVKIDVEGHEINVLKGMRGIIANSPRIKILFEKFAPNIGTELAIEQYFHEIGFALYAVNSDSSLCEFGAGGLCEWGGYVLAAGRGVIDDSLVRSRFSIYAKQLWVPPTISPSAPQPQVDRLYRAAPRGALLFYGPYWFLGRGRWRFKLHGEIRGTVSFSLQERFGFSVQQFTLEAGQSEHIFAFGRDLVYFECAARAASGDAEINVSRIEFVREP
ncbi:MAG: FkbM family methyltransferase [Stellaceae bacterium]